MTGSRMLRACAAAVFTAAVCACGDGPIAVPVPAGPTPLPLRCRIDGNGQPPGFPAVFATETCLTVGCSDEYAMRAVRYEANGATLEKQPALQVEVTGVPGIGAGCEAIIGRFVLDAVTLSHGGAEMRVLQNCVSARGLTVTITDQAGECEPWIVHLPSDVEPIPES